MSIYATVNKSHISTEEYAHENEELLEFESGGFKSGIVGKILYEEYIYIYIIPLY